MLSAMCCMSIANALIISFMRYSSQCSLTNDARFVGNGIKIDDERY